MKMNFFRVLLLILLVYLIPGRLMANEIAISPWLYDHDIKKVVEEYAWSELSKRYDVDIQVKVSRIDARLKLKRCDKFLTLSLTQDNPMQATTGQNTVKVACEDQQAWSLYVPVQLEAWKEVPTLNTPIKKGQVLRSEDLTLQKQNLAKLPQRTLTHIDDIIGKATTRPLMMGSVFYPESLTEPYLIKKGDRVTLTVSHPQMRVSTSAMAQEDGKRGQIIDVKNISSNHKVSAKVTGENAVEIIL